MQSNSKKSFCLLLLIHLLPFFVCITNTHATDVGAQLYLGNCAKCHGREGEGFLKLYPPIRNSRFLKEDVSKLPCIIRNGFKGEIVVDGVTFNQIMPALQHLNPEQIENIISFMQQTWEHPSAELKVDQWLKECKTF